MELPKRFGKKELAAAGLLVVLVVVATYMIRSGDSQEPRLPSVLKKDRKAGAAFDPEKYDVQNLASAGTPGSSAPYDPSGRNLFDFMKPPPTPEEIARAEQAEKDRIVRIEQERIAAQKRAEEEQKRQAEQAVINAEKARLETLNPSPPPITFSYVAYVGPEKERVAVLLDQGGNVIYAKEGDAVQEKWKILRIGYTYVEVGYTDPRHAGKSQPVPLTRKSS